MNLNLNNSFKVPWEEFPIFRTTEHHAHSGLFYYPQMVYEVNPHFFSQGAGIFHPELWYPEGCKELNISFNNLRDSIAWKQDVRNRSQLLTGSWQSLQRYSELNNPPPVELCFLYLSYAK